MVLWLLVTVGAQIWWVVSGYLLVFVSASWKPGLLGEWEWLLNSTGLAWLLSGFLKPHWGWREGLPVR